MSQQLKTKLYESLVELDIVDQQRLEKIRDTSNSLDDFIDHLGNIEKLSQVDVGRLIADLYSVPFVQLSQTPIDDSVFFLIPEGMAKQYEVVLYKVSEQCVHLATAHPKNLELIEKIKKKVQKPLCISYATPRDLSEVLLRYSWDVGKIIDDLVTDFLDKQESNSDETVLNSPVVRILDTLFEYGSKRKASDIHIEPEAETVYVRFRIDGVLHDIVALPKQLFSKIVTRIKVLAKLRTDEHQAAQDGKISIKIKDADIDVRVSVVPTTNGEKIVMRLLSEQSKRFVLAELGLSEFNLKRVQAAQERPYGLILSTGPTGSGKTTSLYAVVKQLNERNVNIMTVEDPVEYDIEGVNQIQVNPKTNLTFADGLRSIVRQDPDIILVGEIRDTETAEIAVNSAMTGHLVLSSLHTNDAATTIPRLIEMEVEPFLIASSLSVIIAQRLVRTICMSCRVSQELSAREIEKKLSVAQLSSKTSTSKEYFDTKKSNRVYIGKGCAACHGSGYKGRIGIFEVLEVSEAIKDLITKNEDADTIRKQAEKEGMIPMFSDGIEKVKRGITTLEEVVRVTKE